MPLFRRRREAEEAGAAVILTEQQLQVRRPKGRDEAVAWEDIAMIRAVAERAATEEGEIHVFLVLGDVEQTAGCVVPAAHAPVELTEWVFGLPGFDRDAYDAAAAAATGEPVTVWVKP